VVADKRDLTNFGTFFHEAAFIPRAPRCYAHESARQLQMCRLSVRNLHYRALKTPWQERGKDIRADE
jgi:hypothetical protein